MVSQDIDTCCTSADIDLRNQTMNLGLVSSCLASSWSLCPNVSFLLAQQRLLRIIIIRDFSLRCGACSGQWDNEVGVTIPFMEL